MKRKLAELINILFGFRKFILMLMIFNVGVIFRIKNYINGSELVDLYKSTAIAFFSANGIEHLTTVVKDYVHAKNGVQPETPPLADLDESNDEEEVEVNV